MRPFTYLFIAILLGAVLSGCSPYSISGRDAPPINPPSDYSTAHPVTGGEEYKGSEWWKNFGDSELNSLVAAALGNNYSLQTAWERLNAAKAVARIAGSERYPQAEISSGASRNRFDPGAARFGGGDIPIAGSNEAIYQSRLFAQSGLSYEVDLWRRISSTVNAEELRVDATSADYENSVQLLAGMITEMWFRASQQKALRQLLLEQIETSKTLLELTELRFTVGRGNAIDVLQQKQQLAALNVELPVVEADYQAFVNQLSILVGRVPGQLADDMKPVGTLPVLPEFPALVRPVDLLQSRPDLRSASLNVQAAEYEIAVAFADRFPRLTLGLSYEFSTLDSSNLFTDEVGRIFSDLAVPVIDGGRRRARVDVREAEYNALVAQFAQQFLEALGDVENSILAEKGQTQLLNRLELQTELARNTLRESQVRYANGLSDYVPVILAVQSVQELERRMLVERRELLIARSRLYRALGDRDVRFGEGKMATAALSVRQIIGSKELV